MGEVLAGVGVGGDCALTGESVIVKQVMRRLMARTIRCFMVMVLVSWTWMRPKCRLDSKIAK